MGRSASEETGEVSISCSLVELTRYYQSSGLAEVRNGENRGVSVPAGEIRGEDPGFRPRVQMRIVRQNKLKWAVEIGFRDRWGFPPEGGVRAASE
jgi:hypothetical protein